MKKHTNQKARRLVSDSLRKLRKASGLTLAELGRRVGTSERTVWSWENGRSAPDLPEAMALAKVLGCTVEDLAGGEPVAAVG